MEEDFCSLRPINDSVLNVEMKLREAFKVKVDFTKMHEICDQCENDLNFSWQFYNQVKENIAYTVALLTEEESEIFVKVEFDHETLLFNEDVSFVSDDPEKMKFVSPVHLNQRCSELMKKEPKKKKLKVN
jgi:hypothetical protein